MPIFKSREGVAVDAYVVTAEEKTLQVPMGAGQHEVLNAGDALVKLNGKQFPLRAELFNALFAADDGETKPKGGKQAASRASE
jgi:hypothetical protein